MKNLLIHSMAEFSSLTIPILSAVGAKAIAEIGLEHGGNTGLLIDYAQSVGGRVHSLDSDMNAIVKARQSWGDQATFVHSRSLDGIPQIAGIDAWFIDGDHNWYTVINELRAIRKRSRQDRKPMLAFLHDVCWPCARRDCYYDPSSIPEAFTHPHDWEAGVVMDDPSLQPWGFRGNGVFAWAEAEGGARNGVLTAVEDFIDEEGGAFDFHCVRAVFGLGILVAHNHPFRNDIADKLEPFADNDMIIALEENRLRNYLEVLRLTA